MKTNATETPDALLVVSSKQLHVSQAAGVFIAVEKESGTVSDSGFPNPIISGNSPAAEALTAPGRLCGEVAFRFMAEAALERGYITAEGLERVCNALYPLEVNQ